MARSLSTQAIPCVRAGRVSPGQRTAHPLALAQILAALLLFWLEDSWGKFLPTTPGEPGPNPDPGSFGGFVSDLASELGIST